MGRLSMTRRTFAKVAAVTAAALGATATAGQALAEQSDAASASAGEVKRIRSCCRGCGKMECGVWVTVQDGRAVRATRARSSRLATTARKGRRRFRRPTIPTGCAIP